MLKDCSIFPLQKFAKQHFGGHSKGIDACRQWLSRLSREVRANDLLLPVGRNSNEHEPVVYADTYGEWWVGRYIGSLEFEGITLNIEPRFGLEFISQQLPLNKFALVNVQGKYIHGVSTLHYLQALMWVNLFAKAAKHCLPTAKTLTVTDSSVIRGKLDVRKTIRNRASGSDKAVSISERKTLTNPVSISIALAFNHIQGWFPQQNLLHWLPDTLSLRLQQILNAITRHHSLPTAREIKKVRYSSLTHDYQPLVKLSMQILSGRGIQLDNESEAKSQGLLLDVAELWEIYVLKVLQCVFADNSTVSHGTNGTDDYLLSSSTTNQRLGKLLPDFIVQDGDSIRLIADAKYKKLGDAPWMSPKRDDLYQMCAYINHYDNRMQGSDHGLLVYPDWSESTSAMVADNSPWQFTNGSELSFIPIPIQKDKAVEFMAQHPWVQMNCKPHIKAVGIN